MLLRLVWAGVVLCTVGGLRAAQVERPNIVLILVDDLGWGDLGCYGNQVFQTPNIDKMAAEGAKLNAYYTCTPAGAGSRVALQTGRYPFRTGLVKSPSPEPDTKLLGIAGEEVTLGEALVAGGYATALVGKWQLGEEPEFSPLRNGYQRFFGLLHNNDDHPVKLYEGDSVKNALVFQPKLTERYTKYALDFIENHQKRPFFLFFSHTMLHKPLAASEKFFGRTPGGLYGDVMAELDDSTGQILAKLKELNLDDNTLVIVTSDNGPWFGGSTGGLRGMKGMSWEGGIRVPFVARWPGHIPAGHTSNEIAGIIDLFPTLLAAAHLKLPGGTTLDGLDIMPVLTGDDPSPHKALYSFVEDKLCTVRMNQWKLLGPQAGPREIVVAARFQPWVDPKSANGMTILAPTTQYHPSDFPGIATGFSTDGFALVDLEADPTEQLNLAPLRKDQLHELRAAFDEMLEQMPAESREASLAVSGEANVADTPSESDTPTETKTATETKPSAAKNLPPATPPAAGRKPSKTEYLVEGKSAEEWAKQLNAENASERVAAMVTLATICRHDASVVPLLAQGLKDPEAANRRTAVGLLELLGPTAQSAIPALRAAATADPTLKPDVDAAVKAIDEAR